jgi:glycosyltransferase involved in cell wall biosynthesis
MHVLLDARLLHRPLSGLERVQRNLVRELVQMPAIGRLQVLVQPGTNLPPDFPARAEIRPVATTEEILRILLDPDPAQQPDVYHLSWFPDRNPRDLWLPLAAHASVVEVHDAILNRHPEYYSDRKLHDWYHGFVCNLVRCSDRLLCHSRSVVHEVERDLGGDPKIADVVPLAVDPVLREPLPAADVQRRLAELGVEQPYFLMVGKDYPHKDHATAFRALARLHPRTRVVCAGSQVWNGPEALADLARQLGIADSVRWIDRLDDASVKALMQGSRALLYPSREEGFGLPPIEAMALGVPVLAAAAMAIPEVCGDGAWLFPPGSVDELHKLLLRVLAGGPEVRSLIERGRSREAQYSWRRCAEQTVLCYQRAIQASRQKKRTRPVLDAALRAVLEVQAACPFSVEQELVAWRERCLSVEHTLQELQGGKPLAGRPAMPGEAPQAGRPATKRARLSLTRRIGKIRDGIKKRLRDR